jgi:hypothetical protein
MRPKPSSETTALIAAYRKAKAQHDTAMEDTRAMHLPDRVHVSIPEIGPRCTVYNLDDLERLSREYIANNGLAGLARIAFQRQMVGYREALTLLESLYQEWRKQQKIDHLEAKECEAYDEVEKTWKALLARIKSHPRDIPEIARYLASPEGSTGDFFRPREALRAIAGVNGKAMRPI